MFQTLRISILTSVFAMALPNKFSSLLPVFFEQARASIELPSVSLRVPINVNICRNIFDSLTMTKAVAAALTAAKAEMRRVESIRYDYYRSQEVTEIFVKAFKKMAYQPDRAEVMQYLRAVVDNDQGYRDNIIQGWRAVAKISRMVDLPIEEIGELQLMMANRLDRFKFKDVSYLHSPNLKNAASVLLASWSPFRLFTKVVYGEKTLQARLIAMQRLSEYGTGPNRYENDQNSLNFALEAFTYRSDLDRSSLHHANLKMIEMMDTHWFRNYDGKLLPPQQSYAIAMISAIVSSQNSLWSGDLKSASQADRKFEARKRTDQIYNALELFIDRRLDVYSRYGYNDIDFSGRALKIISGLSR